MSLLSSRIQISDIDDDEGAPGSGKGTLCKRLFDDHNVIHLSIGDIARQAAAKTNPSAELVEHVRSGTLLPVQAISQFLEDAMDPPEHADMQCIFMIDGAPRKLDQIKHLEDTVRICNPSKRVL